VEALGSVDLVGQSRRGVRKRQLRNRLEVLRGFSVLEVETWLAAVAVESTSRGSGVMGLRHVKDWVALVTIKGGVGGSAAVSAQVLVT